MQKEKSKNEIMKKQKIFVVIIVCFGLLILTIMYQNKTSSISEYGVESVAKIIGFDGGHATSGPSILYQYNVGEKQFEGSQYVENTSKYTDDFYLVRYSSKKPSWSEILLDQPVTDTITIQDAGLSLPNRRMNKFQQK